MVAPNGARRTKADHPALPITDADIVATAQACFAAGAGGIHAHIRDSDGRHLLDAERYAALIAALRDAVPDMAIQITTEAAGLYAPDVQMQVALTSGADMISVSIRELARAGDDVARHFYARSAAQGIAVQHILYDVSDGALLRAILPDELFHDPRLQLLFVLGSYGAAAPPAPALLVPYLDWMGDCRITPDWAVCAFGATEVACLATAAAQGGKCRIGFENALVLSDGTLARDNAEKVADLRSVLSALPPASADPRQHVA